MKASVKWHTYLVSAGLRRWAPTHNPITKLSVLAKHHPKVSGKLILQPFAIHCFFAKNCVIQGRCFITLVVFLLHVLEPGPLGQLSPCPVSRRVLFEMLFCDFKVTEFDGTFIHMLLLSFLLLLLLLMGYEPIIC